MKTLTDTSTFAQFQPLADRICARIIQRVSNAYERFTTEHGHAMPGHRTRRDSQDWKIIQRYMQSASSKDMTFNDERLKRDAEQIGKELVEGFVAKLISKVGDIEMTTLRFSGGADFTIVGNTNGHKITVEQQTVYKVSRHNTFFCQFPARIYVDGKFTSAAKYKEAIA